MSHNPVRRSIEKSKFLLTILNLSHSEYLKKIGEGGWSTIPLTKEEWSKDWVVVNNSAKFDRKMSDWIRMHEAWRMKPHMRE